MATSQDRQLPRDVETTTQRDLLLAQFALYRGIVARKHSVAVWLPSDPQSLSGPELDQWVTFLRDAAHLPPG